MKYLYYAFISLFALLLVAYFSFRNNDKFKTAQDFVSLKLGVRNTIEEVEAKYEAKVRDSLKENEFFKKNGFADKIFIFANKKAQTLSVYGEEGDSYSLIKTYPFTAFSGELGAKFREGDLQIPEGVYKIESFNPNSLFHLSMKINYPNDFDKAKGLERGEASLGGDIMIHGRSSSVGCIAIGDEAIEELFIMSLKAKSKQIDVLILPDLLAKFNPSDIDNSKHYAELIEYTKRAIEKNNWRFINF